MDFDGRVPGKNKCSVFVLNGVVVHEYSSPVHVVKWKVSKPGGRVSHR